ncbi:MAG TPA: hypothetical protein VHC92_04180 [Rhodanobacteraceae bacterium]|jgi:hypothetical protein|nr:hypothetical protein [Rhodanobacteraceae bacterium]
MSIRMHAIAALTLLWALDAHAQQTDASTATYQTPEGQLTVHSAQPGPRTYAAPPPFAQLSGGKAYITQADAEGYDLLANDFIYADSNRDGRISRAEYERWARSRN